MTNGVTIVTMLVSHHSLKFEILKMEIFLEFLGKL